METSKARCNNTDQFHFLGCKRFQCPLKFLKEKRRTINFANAHSSQVSHVKMKALHKPNLEDCLRLVIPTNFCFLLEIWKKQKFTALGGEIFLGHLMLISLG